MSQVFFQPGLVQPLADDDEHLLSLRDGGRCQTGCGGVQLIPLAAVLHEAFHPEDISAGGVGEEGRDVLFQLSTGQTQLEEVGRGESIMRVEVELFAAGLPAAALCDAGHIAAGQIGPVLRNNFLRAELPGALAGFQRAVQVGNGCPALFRPGLRRTAQQHPACIGRLGGQQIFRLRRQCFRQHGVHFVAIANGVDSDDQNSNEFAPFLNIMNEWYLRDLSRKQKTAIRVKGESGKPTTNCAIYGYKKDPENKYHWLIDEEAAAVVRRIFQLTIEGKGPYDIARILFDDKIDTPAVYFGKQNKGVWKSKEEFPNPYNWSGYIVGQILSKPEYMGHTVNFRSHKQSYKDKNAVMNPKEDWLIFENTHEAIVDRETWELAQKLRKTPKRIDTLGEANPLTGLLYCADCGEKMYNHRSKGGTENNPYPSDFFDCSSYTLAHQKRTAACCGHYITTKALRTLILDTIRTVSTFAISNQAAFMEKVRSASQLRQVEAAKDAKRKLSKDKKRIAELDTIIKKLYESFAVGRITDERFDSLLADYEAEQKALQASVAEAEEKLSAFAEDAARVEQFLELARKYTDFSELTTPMINEFIEKIIVHAPERIDGDRVQEVEIHLRFIGQFELPAPELTEEEIKRQEQLKRHRIKSRERYQKIKAGEHAVGQPFMLTCKCCGQEFASKRTNTLFCGPNCRAKFYRQEAAESRSRACTCENCGKEFITTRSDVKYCSDDCRYAAQIKRQGARKKALREAKNEKETKTA